jgi:hypothetical protein
VNSARTRSAPNCDLLTELIFIRKRAVDYTSARETAANELRKAIDPEQQRFWLAIVDWLEAVTRELLWQELDTESRASQGMGECRVLDPGQNQG